MPTPLDEARTGAAPAAGPRPGADESQLSQRRIWIGRLLGPALGLAVYLLLPQDEALSDAARTTAAIAIVMAVWWMTEALPLAVTSLVPLVAFPLAGILELDAATAPYAADTVFLFLGGFVIALAMQKWNLHKRIALVVMTIIGTKPRQLILGAMVATAFLSMWVSNTATTLMMLPIGISILALVAAKGSASGGDEADSGGGPVSEMFADKDTKNFATCLMLAIAFAATIGGLATLIGSPPNLILAGFVENAYDNVTIGFADWMKIGVPLSAVFLVIAWLLLTRVIYPTKLTDVVGGKDVIRSELDKLGPMSRGEWTVLIVFVCTALLWVFREPLTEWEALTSVLPFVANLDDAIIAIGAAIALFMIPVSMRKDSPSMAMDWRSAQSGVPWGVLLLFGGGLSLAAAVQETELSDYIGSQVGGLGVLPTVVLVAAVCLIVLLLTELTSNTATAATFLPVLGGVAVGIGIDPLLLLVPAAFAATCSFMMPVGTPPNAIVFGSGYVTMGQMVRAGVWLNLVASC
ncbi:SLC13 family permease [Saccharomonospora sp. CUA-673]|uniref:SLC13 family permease n=1 Tax=Saccharomonospora sp. CUA-673 TaxID=1904969 RepID=UPI000ACC5F2B|nr:SLC13 family permease [Saccharomonospora sp. CUA-673]